MKDIQPCLGCDGEGQVWTKDGYVVCYDCKGTGEENE